MEILFACCEGDGEKRIKNGDEASSTGIRVGDEAGPEMSEGLWSFLPEEVVEKIFARLPVRNLFQLNLLSKAWGLKLIKSIPFQKEIRSVSTAWKSYCPIYVDPSGMKGFDGTSRSWVTLFHPKSIPNNPLLHGDAEGWKVVSVCGYLICFMKTPNECQGSYHSSIRTRHEIDMEVSNPVNGSWRKLPRLITELWNYFSLIVRIVPLGAEHYMIIVIGDLQPYYVYTYSSLSDQWTEHNRDPYPLLRCKSIQYFEEKVYFLYELAEPDPDDDSEWKDALGVESYHVEQDVWLRHPLPFKDHGKYELFGFLVCQASLMLVGVEQHFALLDEPSAKDGDLDEVFMIDETFIECKETLHILKVTDAWTLEEILTGPPDGIEDVACFLGDYYNLDDCIVLTELTHMDNGTQYCPSLLIYDFKEKKWEQNKLTGELTEPYFNSQCTFKSGLNPFILA